MKKLLANIFKGLFIAAIIVWIGIVLVDYFQARAEKNPIFCIKEETKTYDDGTVYVCTGIGYKMFRYERQSISAVEFGPFFLEERQS